MRLNLGCGNRPIPGFVNVDMFDAEGVDQVWDLTETPWRFERGIMAPSSVTEVVLNHVLEHIGPTANQFFRFMKELYRVCTDGTEITIVVPHPRHDFFLADPTHVRPILPLTLEMFSRKQCELWKAAGNANSLLALRLGVDFELVDTTYALDDKFAYIHTTPEAKGMISTMSNICTEIHMKLVARKPDALESERRAGAYQESL